MEGLDAVVGMVIEENRRVLADVGVQAVRLSGRLSEAVRLFVVGEGRCGLIARMAAMRLMHLGRTVFVVGESVTPALRSGDVLLALSGSGRTDAVVRSARQAVAAGGTVVAVTAAAQSPLAEMAETTVVIAAAVKEDRSGRRSAQFAGSLFEQSSLLLLDAVFHLLAQRQRSGAEELWARHANLE